MKRDKIKEYIKGCRKYIIYVLFLLLFFEFVLQPSRVASGSMEPTLMTNDIIMINKLAYIFGEPEVNDIISFKYDGKNCCKRIIGVEGDFIEFKEGQVYRNGAKVEEQFDGESTFTYCEKSFQVPKGAVFVLGDNRENSYDSRYWENPYIDVDDILGKELLVIPMHFMHKPIS